MAHIAKYKAQSVGHMLAHYRRDRSSLERDNIDPERIKNDLVVGHYTNKDGKLVEGKLPKAAPETVTLSLKVPAAMKRALEKEAKAEGKSTGAYARGILADGLMAIA